MATTTDPDATQQQDPLPPEFFRGVNFLGKPTEVALTGQEPGTPPGQLSAGGAPVGPSPTGTPGAGAPGTPTRTPSALADLMRAIGIGEDVGKLGGGISDLLNSGLFAPRAGSIQTPSGAQTFGAPEILRSQQFGGDFSTAIDVPGFGGAGGGGPGLGGDLGAGGVPTGGELAPDLTAAADTGSLSTALGGLGSAAGEVLPYLGPALGIILGRNQPVGEQALNAGLNVAGAALAGETWGLSAVAAAILELLLDPLFAGGQYIPKRQEAGKEATGALQDIVGGFQEAAGTGDPAQWQQALGRAGGGDRNPVRTDLQLPPDVSAELGFGQRGGVSWSEMTPGQFQQFLARYKANPVSAREWIQGSGDVGYLPQAQAEQVASNAQAQAQAFLDFITGPGSAVAAAPAPETTPLPTAPVGGGVGETPFTF